MNRTTRVRAEFRVTADFAEFERATDWFRSRLPVTTGQLADLDDEARARAWWIAGTAQADVVQHVHESLTDAIAKGTPLEEWKAGIKDSLTKAWGRSNSPRLDTIFRNATQSALIAGRHQQIHDPNVKRFRPYGLFDGITDSRQSAICQAADGTVLPLDHDWWSTHTPQLHHRCRSSIRTLTARQARQRGITEEPTDVESDEGFGGPPVLSSLPPDKTRPKQLKLEFDRKQASAKPPPLIAATSTNPDHTPERWEAVYRRRYGNRAAASVAWGRAMQERGLDLTVDDVRQAMREMVDAGAVGLRPLSTRWPKDGSGLVRNLGDKLTTRHRAAAALAAHRLGITPNLDLTVTDLERFERRSSTAPIVRRALGLFRRVTDAVVQQPTSYVFRFRQARAFHAKTASGFIQFSRRKGALEHEWGHALENLNGALAKAAQEFLASRTQGEEAQPLRRLTGIVGYGSDEVARPDKFLHVYMGRIYPSGDTELTSMGLDMIARGEAAQLLDGDSELFYLVLGQLAGRGIQ